MTLTAQGCGMGPVIADDAKQRILRLPSVESAEVDIVWDPPWNPRMISEEGKEGLRFGVSLLKQFKIRYAHKRARSSDRAFVYLGLSNPGLLRLGFDLPHFFPAFGLGGIQNSFAVVLGFQRIAEVGTK